MDKPGEIDDPTHLTPGGRAADAVHTPVRPPIPDTGSVVAPDKDCIWDELDTGQRRAKLRDVVSGYRQAPPELLVRFSRQALEASDRSTLNLAFEALAKTVTPRLLRLKAWGLAPDERQEQVQQILLSIFEAIMEGRAGFAEQNFASFAKRRAISLYRARSRRLEGVLDRAEPLDRHDPVDDLPDRQPSDEARALLAVALDKLPPKHREAFVQFHRLRRTHDEIASHFEVDPSTVRYWLKKAAAAVGLSGDPHDP